MIPSHLKATRLSALLFLLSLNLISQSWSWIHTESDHLRIYYTGSDKDARLTIREGESFLEEMENMFMTEFSGKIEVWICDNHDQFRHAINAPIQDWAAGAAFPLQKRILIRNPGFVANRNLRFTLVLRHEIAHVLVGDRLGRRLNELPTWFNEGVAMLLSGEGMFFRHDLVLMSNSIWRSIIPLRDLVGRFPESPSIAKLAYAESLSAVSMLKREYGVEGLIAVIDLVSLGETFESAMELALGVSPYSFDERWQRHVDKHYEVMLLLSSSSFIWVVASVIFVIVYINYRRVRRKRLERMALEEESMNLDGELDGFTSDSI
jgi:hypothetical protein